MLFCNLDQSFYFIFAYIMLNVFLDFNTIIFYNKMFSESKEK